MLFFYYLGLKKMIIFKKYIIPTKKWLMRIPNKRNLFLGIMSLLLMNDIMVVKNNK